MKKTILAVVAMLGIVTGWEILASIWLAIITQRSFTPLFWLAAVQWWWLDNWWITFCIVLAAIVPTALLFVFAMNLRPMQRRMWLAWYNTLFRSKTRPWDQFKEENTYGGARQASDEDILERMRK
jgi:hypothetical protein